MRYDALVLGFYMNGEVVEWCGKNLDMDGTSRHVDILPAPTFQRGSNVQRSVLHPSPPYHSVSR